MARKNMAECWLCGAEHEYCPTCGESNGWKYMADTREHYQILLLKRECESGVIPKEDAIKSFATYGITADADLSCIEPNVEREIRDIVGYPEEKTKATKGVKKESKSKLFD